MQVSVGPLTYRVRLVRGYVFHDGEPCYGLCDHRRRLILISDVLDEVQRVQVFCHELLHAWWRHCPGRIDDEESVAELVGLAMTRFIMEVIEDPAKLAFFGRGAGLAEENLLPRGVWSTGELTPGAEVSGTVTPEQRRRWEQSWVRPEAGGGRSDESGKGTA